MSHEFDRYQHTYRHEVERSIRFIGRDLDFFTEAKARALLDVTARHMGPPGRASVLDIGCGPGTTDRFLRGRVAALEGVDVSEPLVEEAARTNPWASYRTYDGETLPFPDGRFDVAFAISVVHHLPPGRRAAFAREMGRVVRPGGLAVVFEHNPYNPLTRVAVARCDFDRGVVLCSRGRARALFTRSGLRIAEDRYILFFPWRHRAFGRVERGLGWLPLGAQYLVAATRA